MSDWRDYEEEAAKFFRSLGMQVQTQAELAGVRTSHDLDVLVRSSQFGFDMLWVVECKLWKTPVSKLHVLGLRQIVIDVGADRGILLSESGFQRGAAEAAELTNVQLTSMRNLKRRASFDIGLAELRSLQEWADLCHERYWSLPKDFRIAQGLRPEVGLPGYSMAGLLRSVNASMDEAFRGRFPIEGTRSDFGVNTIPAMSPAELAEAVRRHLADAERRLNAAEEEFRRIGGAG